MDEITALNQETLQQKTRLNSNIEKIASMQRELDIKSNQMQEYEKRYNKLMDELDLAQYRLQD